MRRSSRKTLISFALGILLAGLTAECVSHQVLSFRLSYDPVLREFVYAPGSVVRYRLEGHGVSRWTTHGVRRAEMPAYNPEARPILVLGDSFTEALQVNDAEVFTHLLEESLRQDGIQNPVLNRGRSSRSVADYVAFAEREIALFNPAWVVVQVRENDFTDDAWDPRKASEAAAHFDGPLDGPLRIATPPVIELSERSRVRNVSMWLRNTFSVVQFGFERLGDLRSWVANEPPPFVAHTVESAPQATPSWQEYPIKDELEQLAAAYAGRLTLLLVSEFDPRSADRVSPFEAYLAKVASESGISLVTLSSDYPALAAQGAAPFGFPNGVFNEGHMNSSGHALAARALSAELKRIHRVDGLH